MRNWLRFFFGTPQRFTTTAIVISLIIVLCKPGMIQEAVNRLISELMPLVQFVIIIGVFWLIFRAIFRGILGK